MRTRPSVRRMRRARQKSIARYLSDEQLKLYTLIWRRFVASQMVPAVYDVTTAKHRGNLNQNQKKHTTSA